jgi:putative transcriptional regulator
MSVCYKKLQHMLIEREISHSQLMREAHISANIISKIKTGQYIALDKVESICNALNCTPNDILVFLPDNPDSDAEADIIASRVLFLHLSFLSFQAVRN